MSSVKNIIGQVMGFQNLLTGLNPNKDSFCLLLSPVQKFITGLHKTS